MFDFTWQYKALSEITIFETRDNLQVRLLCEDDEGGDLFSVACTEGFVEYLSPYTEQFDAWLQDPLSHEKPVIPVIYNESGKPRFSHEGALHDFPELRKQLRTVRRFSLVPSLIAQALDRASRRRHSSPEAIVQMILRSATKTG